MYNGDTAIVSMQYSFLPSWLSFLVDKENARQAGQALFEAVSARVRAMPEAVRPKLVVFGKALIVRRRSAVPFGEQHRCPHRRCAVLRSHVQQLDVAGSHAQPR